MEVPTAGQAVIDGAGQEIQPAVEPSLALDEVEEQHPGKLEQRQGVTVALGTGQRQRGSQSIQGGPERSKEPPANTFAFERLGRARCIRKRPTGCSDGADQSVEARESHPVRRG